MSEIVGEDGSDGSSDNGGGRGVAVGEDAGDAVQFNTLCFFSTHVLAGISGNGEIGQLEGASLAWTTWTTEDGEVVSLDGFEVTGEVAMDPRSSSVTICVEAPGNNAE